MHEAKPTDLNERDVVVEQVDGKYRAVLGFLVHNGSPKFYAAFGDTPKQAKEFLYEVMKRDLEYALTGCGTIDLRRPKP